MVTYKGNRRFFSAPRKKTSKANVFSEHPSGCSDISCALKSVHNLLVLEDPSSALALWKIYLNRLEVNRAWECVGDALLDLLIPNKSYCAHSSPY